MLKAFAAHVEKFLHIVSIFFNFQWRKMDESNCSNFASSETSFLASNVSNASVSVIFRPFCHLTVMAKNNNFVIAVSNVYG